MTELNHKLRVAIVEDEPLIAENLAMYLNNTDFEVAGIAYNYEDALQLIINEHPDIALLDINLESDKDGIDLGEYIFNRFVAGENTLYENVKKVAAGEKLSH